MILVVAAWTAALSVLLALTLTLVRQRSITPPAPPKREALVRGLLLAAMVGSVAGAAGQGVFALLAAGTPQAELSRLPGWLLLGWLLAFGLSLVVPDLPRQRAIPAGLLGGLLAGGAFTVLLPLAGESAARLGSAALLGLALGLAMVVSRTVDLAAPAELARRESYVLPCRMFSARTYPVRVLRWGPSDPGGRQG